MDTYDPWITPSAAHYIIIYIYIYIYTTGILYIYIYTHYTQTHLFPWTYSILHAFTHSGHLSAPFSSSASLTSTTKRRHWTWDGKGRDHSMGAPSVRHQLMPLPQRVGKLITTWPRRWGVLGGDIQLDGFCWMDMSIWKWMIFRSTPFTHFRIVIQLVYLRFSD